MKIYELGRFLSQSFFHQGTILTLTYKKRRCKMKIVAILFSSRNNSNVPVAGGFAAAPGGSQSFFHQGTILTVTAGESIAAIIAGCRNPFFIKEQF